MPHQNSTNITTKREKQHDNDMALEEVTKITQLYIL